MERLAWKRRKSKIRVIEKREALSARVAGLETAEPDIRVSLIQALIPLGLKQVNEELQAEVMKLAGQRGKHGKMNRRWGSQGGSVYLSDQKVPLKVPRVRNKPNNLEIPLETYYKFQAPYESDKQVFLKLLNGISTHRYRECAALAPEVFGLSASSVSRKFRRWSAGYLKRLMNRRLDRYDFVAVYIDGKAYAREGLVIALGVTLTGDKIILGLEQMNTENSTSVGQFIEKLISRGLSYEQGLLVVVDGSRGIIKAVREKLARYMLIQRCRQHKKENVVSYLPLGQQKLWRVRMEQAYGMTSCQEAASALSRLHKELAVINPSAAASLHEGLMETLTLHRLGLQDELYSLASTNGIESLLSNLGQYTDKVDRWRNGRHIQEWAAAGLLHIEPRLRKLMGYRYLPELRERLQKILNLRPKSDLVVERELVSVEA
jgi:transposase-like protein